MNSLSIRRPTSLLFACCVVFHSAGRVDAQLPADRSLKAQPEKKIYEPGDVQLEQSRVYVYVGKAGFGHEHAIAGTVASGHIQLGVEENAGELVFNLANFVADPDYARKFLRFDDTSDPATQATVTQNMHSPSVLAISKFPTANYTIQAVRPTGNVSQRKLPIYEFDGEFTLHGTKRPLKFLAEVEQRPGWTRIFGKFSMLQTDFGITPFTKAFGTIGVSDQLTVYGDLWIANPKATAEVPATIR